MINRASYLNKLLDFKDTKLIKIITGIRRSGKSTLLMLLKEHLINSGVLESQIITINFEYMRYDFITDYKILYEYIEDRVSSTGKTYILLDEIQVVERWEKVINSLTVDYDVDVYITGSNAYLLSSKLATLLSGRYVEIKMLPLSFKEFLEFNVFESEVSIEDRFKQYVKYGGMPSIAEMGYKEDTINTFLSGIYSTVIMKDIVQRNRVKDVALLESVTKFVISNIGNIISAKKISDFLNSDGRKTTSETIENYLTLLRDAYIIYRVQRYDVRGKQHLKTLCKYYVVDLGIRNMLLGYRDVDRGHILENIVYFELLRRGYAVDIGKIGDKEIDFIATSPNNKIYYQVCETMAGEATRERELAPLQQIDDNYRKIILSMDRDFIRSIEGIELNNILDFLLE